MKHSVLGVFVSLLLVLTACGGDGGSIEVEDATFRLGRSDLGAGYMTVTNSTGETVTLEAVSAEGVGRIELHETLLGDGDIATMQERPDGFEIAAGETITLEPGGKHLMIFDPESSDDLDLVLDFGDETVTVVAAFDAEASAQMDDMDHSNMNMDEMDDMEMDEMEDMADEAMDDAMESMEETMEEMEETMEQMDDDS